MIRLTQITLEQLEWYKEKTGGFYGMDFNFGGPSGFFGFYGEFDISSEGQVDLANLLVAHSCEHEQEEMIAEISAMRQTIMDGLWSATLCQENRLEAVWEEFKLEFFPHQRAMERSQLICYSHTTIPPFLESLISMITLNCDLTVPARSLNCKIRGLTTP